MRSKRQITRNMLAVAAGLLSLAYLCSCAANKKMEKQNEIQTDSVDVFIPTHPPVVVPHSWREKMNK